MKACNPPCYYAGWQGNHYFHTDDGYLEAPTLRALPGPVGDFISALYASRGDYDEPLARRSLEAWAFMSWLATTDRFSPEEKKEKGAFGIAMILVNRLEREIAEIDRNLSEEEGGQA